MKLLLQAEKQTWHADETVVVRVLALNDSYEPAALDRRLLVGPNPAPQGGQMPPPAQVEPAFAEEERNQIYLNPWCLYGRERRFTLPAGKVTFYGYLLRRWVSGLLPLGPAEADALLAEAEPLVLTIL